MSVGADAGIRPGDLQGLSTRRARRLLKWHFKVAGNDDGRPWWPLAVRRLDVDLRLRMAEDEATFAHWVELERRRVEDPNTGALYFTESYGHVQPDRAGAVPIPFEMWPMVEAAAERALGARCQREVMEAFVRERIVVVLKARQLGLTWLALHFALWLMSYALDLPRAKVLALSKREDDANKLLRRLRKINELLPPYMRRAEDRETRGSNSRFKLVGRGEAISLVSTPDTARSEQGDLFLWDEAAFTRNRGFAETWTAANPTLGDEAKAIIISTGNGPEQVPGDGQGFAELFRRAIAGSDGMVGVFLPDDVHPARDPAWRARKRREFLTQDAFEQEHALTVDQALRGKQGDKVYSTAGVAAAERLGAEMDELMRAGDLAEPAGGAGGLLATGLDWGTHTHLLPIWELEGGGIYIPPGEHASFNVEVSEKTIEFHARLREQVQDPDGEGCWPLIGEARYDSAGVEQMRTFVRVIEGRDGKAMRQQWQMVRTNSKARPWRVATVSVRFNRYKGETIAYLQWLFNRSARYFEASEDERERWGVIAISPKNVELLRQLQGLEWDENGKVKKLDDHGPDALIAGAAPIAAEHRERVSERPKDDNVNSGSR